VCSPRHLNIAILPWSPLCGGALTGKYLAPDVVPANARFALWPDRYARYNTPKVMAAVDKYVKIAGEAGCTPAQLAYAWCKCAPCVCSADPIVQCCTPAQLAYAWCQCALHLLSVLLDSVDCACCVADHAFATPQARSCSCMRRH
jgi:aryl-alcohol dehydrogenase-like predicted oxidoreductase